MTNFYFLSYKEWLNLVMIFRSYDFSFLSNERPRLTTRAQVFQNQKYSNCRHCSLLSAFLFRVTSAFTSAFLFRVGYICISLSCWWWLQVLTSVFLYLHFSFVLVDICISLSCWWTAEAGLQPSVLLFRVGGHLHFSFVLATSALIFRVDCKYLHPHFSSADVTRATENTSPASKDWTRQMSTGQRHGCNRILVLDRNLDYPTLARWPTYFVQPPPPDDFANCWQI